MGKNNADELLTLEINKALCKDCKECEKLLPKFRSVYNGKISISAWAYQREDVRRGVKSVIEVCKQKAISLY